MLKIFIALLLLPLCLTYTFSFIHLIISPHVFNINVKAFILGVMLYLLWIFVSLFREKSKFGLILEHELTHLLWIKLMGGQAQSLKISKQGGGEIQHTRLNFFVSLAPYFFPTYTFFIFLILPLIKVKFKPFFMIAIGFTTAYHFLSTMIELKSKQPDIKQTGLLFSYVFIYLMNIFFFGLIVSYVFLGYKGTLDFIKSGFWLLPSLFL